MDSHKLEDSPKEKTINPQKSHNSVKNPSLLKLLIKHNPIDPLVDITRAWMKFLGILPVMDNITYWKIGRANFIRIFRKLWTYNITGAENFPKHGAALLIANHTSELDPFLAGSAVNRKIQWLSKKENFEIPLFKSFIKPFGTIPLRRGENDQEAMKKVKNVLRNGGCIGMFPEGTRSPTGELGQFHSGAARLCLELKIPYVPIHVFGAYKIFPKSAKKIKDIKFRGQQISIIVGKPVYISPDLENTYDDIQRIKNAMRNDIVLLSTGIMNDFRTIRRLHDTSLVQETHFTSPLHFDIKIMDYAKNHQIFSIDSLKMIKTSTNSKEHPTNLHRNDDLLK